MHRGEPSAVLWRAEGLRHRPRARRRARAGRRRARPRARGAVDVSADPRGVRGAALVSNCRVVFERQASFTLESRCPKPNTLANAQRVARVPNQPSDLRARFIVTAGPTQSISACAEPRAMTIEGLEMHLMLAELPAGARPRLSGAPQQSRDTTRTPRREPRPRARRSARAAVGNAEFRISQSRPQTPRFCVPAREATGRPRETGRESSAASWV